MKTRLLKEVTRKWSSLIKQYSKEHDEPFKAIIPPDPSKRGIFTPPMEVAYYCRLEEELYASGAYWQDVQSRWMDIYSRCIHVLEETGDLRAAEVGKLVLRIVAFHNAGLEAYLKSIWIPLQYRKQTPA